MLSQLLLSICELAAAGEVCSEECRNRVDNDEREFLLHKELGKVCQGLHLLFVVKHACDYDVVKRLLRVCTKPLRNLRYTFWSKC